MLPASVRSVNHITMKGGKRYPRFLRRMQELTRERRYSPAANLSAPGFTASMTVPSVAGVMVTPQTALTFSAYYAGVRVITEDLASLPLAMFRRLPDGGAALERDHPVSYFFNRSPDGECNDLNWRESWYHHALGWGNGYAEIIWDAGQPKSLHLIHPSVIQPKREQKSGQLYYELSTADAVSASRGQKYAMPYQILHLAMLGFNGIAGYSIVALMRELIGTGKSQEQWAASLFGNGAWPSGLIRFKRHMKPEALKNFRESWNLVHQGSAAAHKIAILEEDAEWVPNSTSPEDAQMVAARMFQVIDMCRVLRLPPHKLADFSQAHLDNIEAANEDYLLSCLRPFAVRVEKSVDFKLLTDDDWRAGFYTKHDFRPLLLRTSKDKSDYYQKLFQIGYYTVDEIRELEGENPIGEKAGGRKRFVQGQLVDITKDRDPGTVKQSPAADGDPGRPERFSFHANGAHH